MSKPGLSLCGIYAILNAACIGYALLGNLDAKSRFMFLQMPIVLQAALVERLGFDSELSAISWPMAYLIFLTPIFALLYSMGLAIDSATKKNPIAHERHR